MGQKLLSFAKTNQVPYYTFAEDVAASGGYWLLCTGDKVYANQSSLVGSIGVISTQVAAKSLLDRKNIGRTTIATNENLLEARFDPLSKNSVSQQDMEFVNKIQEEIFSEFRDHVLKYRKHKLSPDSTDQVFSADVVTGIKAKQIGLVDEVGMFEATIKALHPGIKVVNFSKQSQLELFA